MSTTGSPACVDAALDDRELARASLENEIRACLEAARALRTRLNTLCHIGALFPELLEQIFIHGRDAGWERSYGPSNEWIRVSHVCRNWRDIALQSSRLWCHISLTRQDCVKEFLRRSREAPLCIEAGSTSFSLSLAQRTIDELPRVQDMQISHFSRTSLRVPLSDAITAPALQRLVVRDMNESEFPNFLFNGGAPMLEELRTYGFTFIWRSGFRHSKMKHLTIEAKSQNGSRNICLSTIIDALDGMPLLETLDLQFVLPLQAAKAAPNHSHVNLLHLCSLDLASSTFDFGGLLGYLIVPSHCAISLHATTLGQKEVLASDLSKQFSSTSLRCLHISASNNMSICSGLISGGFEITGWTQAVTLDIEKKPNIRIEIAGTVTSRMDILYFLCQILPTSDVDELIIEEFQQLAWTKILASMHNLRILRVIATPIIDFPKSLRVTTPDGPQHLLPRLDILEFRDITFSWENADRYAELEDCFIERFESLIEMPELTISHCYRVKSCAINSLRQIVPIVHWEGYGSSINDESKLDWSGDDDDGSFGYDWPETRADFDYDSMDDD